MRKIKICSTDTTGKPDDWHTFCFSEWTTGSPERIVMFSISEYYNKKYMPTIIDFRNLKEVKRFSNWLQKNIKKYEDGYNG